MQMNTILVVEIFRNHPEYDTFVDTTHAAFTLHAVVSRGPFHLKLNVINELNLKYSTEIKTYFQRAKISFRVCHQLLGQAKIDNIDNVRHSNGTFSDIGSKNDLAISMMRGAKHATVLLARNS
jgi:hypothetical protein